MWLLLFSAVTRPVSSQKASIALLLISYTRRVTSFVSRFFRFHGQEEEEDEEDEGTRRPGLSPTGNNDDFYYCRSLLTRQARVLRRGMVSRWTLKAVNWLTYGAPSAQQRNWNLNFEEALATASVFPFDVLDAFAKYDWYYIADVCAYKTWMLQFM